MAYPWIFLVADDHGRFEYKPRMVWKHAFAYRQDVTVEDVAKWMDEYWREGLLVRYHIDGELAYWYKFRGRKPSERRPSEYADPKGIPAFTYQGATSSRVGGDEGATKGRRGGGKPAPEIEQSRDRAEQNRSAAAGASGGLARTQPRATWLSRPGELWRARWGPESEPPWGEMGQAFAKPKAEFEARGALEDLWGRWELFLAAAQTSQFARPARFVQGLGEWGAQSRASPPGGKKSLDERAMDSAREAIEAHRARAK